MKIKINNINELIELGRKDILTPNDYAEVVSNAISVIFFPENYTNTIAMADTLEKFWNTYKDSIERPLFFDLDLD